MRSERTLAATYRLQPLRQGRHRQLPERRDGRGQCPAHPELHPRYHRVHIPARVAAGGPDIWGDQRAFADYHRQGHIIEFVSARTDLIVIFFFNLNPFFFFEQLSRGAQHGAHDNRHWQRQRRLHLHSRRLQRHRLLGGLHDWIRPRHPGHPPLLRLWRRREHPAHQHRHRLRRGRSVAGDGMLLLGPGHQSVAVGLWGDYCRGVQRWL